jgi:glutathione S-transferase
VERIDSIWSGCRRAYGDYGPWLFGAYSAADAMYAPVALRLLTYGLQVSPDALGYQQTVLADEHLGRWITAAEVEAVIIPEDETGEQD